MNEPSPQLLKRDCCRAPPRSSRCAAGTRHHQRLARARVVREKVNEHPSASGFDRLAPKSPHSSAPAPPGSKPLAEAPPSRARGNAHPTWNAGQKIVILRNTDQNTVELGVQHAEWLRAMQVSVRDYYLPHDVASGRTLPIETFHAKLVVVDDTLALCRIGQSSKFK